MKNLVCTILAGALSAGVFAAEPDGIFSYKAGRIEIHLLVETRRPGNTGILVGASEADIKRYFPAGTYTAETNTFLIKTPGRTIVVDTGFGGAIFDALKKLGVEPAQVDAVLLTHLHGDHIGGLQKDGKALFPRAAIYLAAREKDYWTKTSVNQGVLAALAPYEGRIETFTPGALGARLAELLPGIVPIAAYGHTPGHTAYLVEDGGERLLIWGDLMHAELIQFPLPGVSVSYDTDPAAAAATRRQFLDYAAKNKIPIGGMHLLYPAIGTVTPSGPGYTFSPAK
jgi:glyoxylase-like metal-dependent hydrolase (beta-lactamase superfamily II)